MRSVPALALVVALTALAGGRSWASDPPGTRSTPAAPVPAGSTATADNEAAARHAKRTACINQARVKKLVGAQKTAFIKGCIGAP